MRIRFVVLIIFLLALSLRLGYLVEIHQVIPELLDKKISSPEADQYRYNQAAIKFSTENIKESLPFDIAPLYPLFLGTIYRMLDYDPFMAKLFQIILGSILVVLIYKISSKKFNPEAGVISAFMVAVYNMFIMYDVELLRASFLTFLSIFALSLLIIAESKPHKFSWIISGIAMGLILITKQNYLLLIFILIWIGIKFKDKGTKKALSFISCFLLGVILIISLPTFANYLISKRFVLIASQGPESFWIGNTPNAPGVGYTAGLRYQWEEEVKKLQEESQGSTPKTTKIFLRQLKTYPGKYLKLYLRKLRVFLNGYEVPGNINYYAMRVYSKVLGLPLLSFNLLSPLAIFGMLLLLKEFKNFSLLYLFAFAWISGTILFFIRAEYRIISVALLIPFAAYTIFWLKEKFLKKTYPQAIFSIAIILSLGFINKPDDSFLRKYPEYFYCHHTALASAYEMRENLDRAIREYRSALSFYSSPVRASIYDEKIVLPVEKVYFRLATTYAKAGYDDEAIEAYKKCVRLNPYFTDAHYNLGVLYNRKGNKAKALNQVDILRGINQELANSLLTVIKP